MVDERTCRMIMYNAYKIYNPAYIQKKVDGVEINNFHHFAASTSVKV